MNVQQYPNTPICIMVHISFSVCAIQILQVLLNSLGVSAYKMKLVFKYYTYNSFKFLSVLHNFSFLKIF